MASGDYLQGVQFGMAHGAREAALDEGHREAGLVQSLGKKIETLRAQNRKHRANLAGYKELTKRLREAIISTNPNHPLATQENRQQIFDEEYNKVLAQKDAEI